MWCCVMMNCRCIRTKHGLSWNCSQKPLCPSSTWSRISVKDPTMWFCVWITEKGVQGGTNTGFFFLRYTKERQHDSVIFSDPAETEETGHFAAVSLDCFASSCMFKVWSSQPFLSTVKYPLMSLDSALLTTSVCFVSDSHLNCKHDAKLKIVFHQQRKSLVLRLQSTLTTSS